MSAPSAKPPEWAEHGEPHKPSRPGRVRPVAGRLTDDHERKALRSNGFRLEKTLKSRHRCQETMAAIDAGGVTPLIRPITDPGDGYIYEATIRSLA